MVRDAFSGMKDGVRLGDELSIRMAPARKVLCVVCHRHIYYLKEQKDGTYGFAPCEQGYPVRNDMTCPVCGGFYCGYINDRPMIKTDRGWV